MSDIIRGNGTNNNAHTVANLTRCVPKFPAMVQGCSILALKNPLNNFHANHTADRPAATGITTVPIALYARGSKLDIAAITSENIWHDQHDEKKFIASAILTGDAVRNIEKPTITPRPAIPPITSGATAPAVNGRNETKRIQNFFSLFIV